nr:hypothetical protein [Angustibacter aerolatus]
MRVRNGDRLQNQDDVVRAPGAVMRRTTTAHRYPTTAALAVLALLAALLALPAPPTARAADGDTPLPTSVTVAGDFQSAVGCDDNWQADCALTHLPRVGDEPVFQGKVFVPPGTGTSRPR